MQPHGRMFLEASYYYRVDAILDMGCFVMHEVTKFQFIKNI